MDETTARFCIRPAGDLAEVRYQGAIAGHHLASMRDAVLSETRGAKGLIIRMDTGLLLFNELPVPATAGYRSNGVPAAVVVSESGYAMHVEYSRRLAALGVIRAVFLPDQIEQARLWAGYACRVKAYR